MKNAKQLLRGIAVLVVLTIFTNCNGTGKEKPKYEEEPKEIKEPDGIISLKEANAIFENYSDHRVAIIENYEARTRPSQETFKAARFVSYDLKTIKDYIAYVEQESKKAGVTPKALRFYFANYPDNTKFPNGDEVVHRKQNSIFILPTLNEKGKEYGYYIGENGKAKYIKDWKAELGDGSEQSQSKSEASLIPSFNSLFYSSKSLVLNRGNSGPPPFGDF